jgi:hypothetical protein
LEVLKKYIFGDHVTEYMESPEEEEDERLAVRARFRLALLIVFPPASRNNSPRPLLTLLAPMTWWPSMLWARRYPGGPHFRAVWKVQGLEVGEHKIHVACADADIDNFKTGGDPTAEEEDDK